MVISWYISQLNVVLCLGKINSCILVFHSISAYKIQQDPNANSSEEGEYENEDDDDDTYGTYPNDSASAGKVYEMRKCWDILCQDGPIWLLSSS